MERLDKLASQAGFTATVYVGAAYLRLLTAHLFVPQLLMGPWDSYLTPIGHNIRPFGHKPNGVSVWRLEGTNPDTCQAGGLRV